MTKILSRDRSDQISDQNLDLEENFIKFSLKSRIFDLYIFIRTIVVAMSCHKVSWEEGCIPFLVFIWLCHLVVSWP